ncbi:MAG: hypothetical protein ACRBB6_04470 [Neptuniibacter sp.]
MPDICDLSDEKESFLLEARINAARNSGPSISPMGSCYNCEEKFPEGSPKLFCDADCATDWEKFK